MTEYVCGSVFMCVSCVYIKYVHLSRGIVHDFHYVLKGDNFQNSSPPSEKNKANNKQVINKTQTTQCLIYPSSDQTFNIKVLLFTILFSE